MKLLNWNLTAAPTDYGFFEIPCDSNLEVATGWVSLPESVKMSKGDTIMSAPVSDHESSEHQKYAPKWLREQAQIPAAPQLQVGSPPMSPSHAQILGDRGETLGLPSSEGNLENEVPRRLYEPEPVSQPQLDAEDTLC